MEQFYIITITVAVVLLILILTYIGVYVMGGSDKTPYPPESLQCPDYWEKSGADCIIPGANTTNAGTRATGDTNNFANIPSNAAYIANGVLKTDDASWQTSDGLSAKCAKKLWANNNNVVWDGISNYNSC